MNRPLFIIGLQKSGTSPLNRALQSIEGVGAPFDAEGNDFWGNRRLQKLRPIVGFEYGLSIGL